MSIEHLKDRAYWVKPGQLLAGGYAGSFTHNGAKEKIDWLLDKGVNFFVDLTEAGELNPYAPLLPAGITHKRMPIVDMNIPTQTEMVATLDVIDKAIAGKRGVYVHCWGGKGRTGTVVGCWLVRHGMTPQAALDQIVRLRDGRKNSPEAPEQFAFIRNWKEGQ
jgi:protein-tyrosine phosphatase